MIHEQVLRRKGWSEAEISHAHRILAKADSQRGKALHAVERATLVLLAALIIAGAAGTGMALAQLSLIDPWWLAAGTAFPIGLCLGALAHRASATLGSPASHVRIACAAMLIAGLIACAATAAIADGRWIVLAVPFTIGAAPFLLFPEVRT